MKIIVSIIRPNMLDKSVTITIPDHLTYQQRLQWIERNKLNILRVHSDLTEIQIKKAMADGRISIIA